MNIWLAEIWRAWRASVRKPGFLLLATGVLALGIGSSVAVFTLIDQVLMQSLPLPNVSRVMVVGPLEGGEPGTISPQQYQHIGKVRGVVSTGLAYSVSNVNIAGGGPPEVVSSVYINRSMLPTLGLHPVLGRNFTARETVPNGPHVVMLGYGFWQHRFGGATDVIGKTLEIKGTACTIIGVLPKTFASLSFSGEVVLPLALPPHTRADGTNFTAVARLTKGASRQAVAARIDVHLHTMYVEMAGGSGSHYGLHEHFGIQPITAWQHSDAHTQLMLFMACALFVLLTALVNLFNLMLLRSLTRTHDGAVRAALGASPMRLALPALAEGLLIGVVGALVGTALATLCLHVLQGTLSADWLPSGGLGVKPWIWLLALGVAIVGTVLAAAFGVWRGRAVNTADELREGGRSGMGRRSGLTGRALVVTQVVLATVLLCGSGLLLHGLYQAASTPLGFSSANMLAFDLAPVRTTYPDAKSVNVLSRRIVRRLKTIPGVTAAVATTNLPSGSMMQQFNLAVRTPGGRPTHAQYRGIGSGFFKLFGIPLLRGRTFTHNDVRGGEAVAVVSRSLAQQMFAGHAIGKRIERGHGAHAWSVRIVGVVGNTRQFGPLKRAPPMLYVPLAQVPNHLMRIFRHFFPMRFVLHGHGDVNQWRAAVRAAVAAVAPNQPISNFRTMRHVVRTTTATTRKTLLLVGVFAALALLLAVAGLYAVMAVAVAAREREFGVRLALGSSPARLVRLVLRGGLIQIVVGLVIGVAIVLGVSGTLASLLRVLTGHANALDPVALVAVCVLLATAGLLACLVPALRAGRVQPMRVLRGE